MEPVYFKDQDEFRGWLEKNHDKAPEITVIYYKTETGKPSMTWSQSVDQAICFGWIDGIRGSIDNERYCIRFTPRNIRSTWSKINIRKAEELKKEGLMTKAGLYVYENRKKVEADNENEITSLDDTYERMIEKNKNAWDYYIKQPPSYKKNVARWIMSAKQEATKLTRLNKLIDACEKNTRLY
jgi:uncharacterized protein YdeI (YjbR/CyaY-like superfamily)